ADGDQPDRLLGRLHPRQRGVGGRARLRLAPRAPVGRPTAVLPVPALQEESRPSASRRALEPPRGQTPVGTRAWASSSPTRTRTWEASVLRSCSARSSTGIGEPITTRTVPGRTANPRGGRTRPAPSIALGTTDAPAAIGAAKPPLLNAASSPSRLRVPSGNRTTLLPDLSSAVACPTLSRAPRRRRRSTKTIPMAAAYQPTSGMRRSSFLSTKERGTGRAAKSTGTSR